MQEKTPKSLRVHIGIFGKRNAGKSSLLNALTHQDVAIVDATPGTTTDVVSQPMEFKPIGPVIFLDTAGLDDEGTLGLKRVGKTMAALDRTDLALVVCEGAWSRELNPLMAELKNRAIPGIIVFTKCDLYADLQIPRQDLNMWTPHVVKVSSKTQSGMDALRQAVVAAVPKPFFENPPILSDLIGPGDLVVMVVPIDLEAPKGRLIMPQVQTLREILDCDAKALVVKERELSDGLANLKQPPRLVITDSQAILKVAADVPESIPLTGFSVLFARWKGDLETFVQGLKRVDELRPGDRILLLESCAHHPIEDDIGRVKIPRWLRQYTGADLGFDHFAGHDLPADLSGYRLIIHCGACMGNRQEMLSRILKARAAGVPITNYGLVIAKSLGVIHRMLSPFPHLQDLAE